MEAILKGASVKRFVRNFRAAVKLHLSFGVSASVMRSCVMALRQNVWPRRSIHFTPEEPDQFQILSKLCVVNAYRMCERPESADLIHKHCKATRSPAISLTKHRDRHVLNVTCNDISKKLVQERFEAVFGYALEIDPRTFRGLAVRKSDDNYRHDGLIVECPIAEAPVEGVVYQMLIDSSDGKGNCIDFRVPVIGNEIPLVYVKPRPIDDRFATYSSAQIADTSEVLEPEEIAQILRFCRSIGMDFGEMDVLRDNTDGRIYIVDANNTPAGPPVKLSDEDKRFAVQILAAAYERLVEAVLAGTYASGQIESMIDSRIA
jgi:hypothetical protein